MSRCCICGCGRPMPDSERRRFLTPECFMRFPDGREARPLAGVEQVIRVDTMGEVYFVP